MLVATHNTANKVTDTADGVMTSMPPAGSSLAPAWRQCEVREHVVCVRQSQSTSHACAAIAIETQVEKQKSDPAREQMSAVV
jgi:hypothetical protein